MADARWFEEPVSGLQEDWRERAGNPRRGSATRLLIDALPAAPVLTVATAAELARSSFQATNLAVDRMVDAGVLVQVNVGRRNRAFEAPELIDALTALEHRMTSSLGDTLTSQPTRDVPRGQPVFSFDGQTKPEIPGVHGSRTFHGRTSATFVALCRHIRATLHQELLS